MKCLWSFLNALSVAAEAGRDLVHRVDVDELVVVMHGSRTGLIFCNARPAKVIGFREVTALDALSLRK